MRKSFLLMALVFAAAPLCFTHPASAQSPPLDQAKQEIVAQSLQFAREAVVNEALASRSATNPPAITLVKDGEAEPLEMKDVEVRIDGGKATLTSLLVFRGQRANGQAYERAERWEVELQKEGERWQVVRGRLGSKKRT